MATNSSRGLPLDEAEKTKLAALDAEASLAQQKKIIFLKRVARKKGITSKMLKGLKSKNGKRFVEEKGHKPYRKALVREDFLGSEQETAYLCCGMYLQKDPSSCGWVKGDPVEKPYDEIGCLSGSRGIRYYCRICGKLIGEFQMEVS